MKLLELSNNNYSTLKEIKAENGEKSEEFIVLAGKETNKPISQQRGAGKFFRGLPLKEWQIWSNIFSDKNCLDEIILFLITTKGFSIAAN